MFSSEVAYNVVLPIIIVMMVGNILVRVRLIDSLFISKANKLAYNFTLPLMLFDAVSRANIPLLFDIKMALTGILSTVITILLFSVVTHWLGFHNNQRGVIIQGTFRANMAIIGLALCAGLYGQDGIALTSVYLAIIIPLFNVAAVTVLVRYSGESRNSSMMLKEILSSPLVLAVSLALPISVLEISLPQTVQSAVALVGNITLPLALLCIGGNIRFRNLNQRWAPLCLITFGKIIVNPTLVMCIALGLGMEGQALIILLLLSMAPVATASFPIIQQIGGDKELAADAIALTTVLCLPVYMLVISLI